MYFLNVLFSWFKNAFIKFFAQASQYWKYSLLGSLVLTALLELYIYMQKAKVWSTFNIFKITKF